MEAKCKLTRIIGFTCCLAILAAMSTDRAVGKESAPDSLTPTLMTVEGTQATKVVHAPATPISQAQAPAILLSQADKAKMVAIKDLALKGDSLTGFVQEYDASSPNRSAMGGYCAICYSNCGADRPTCDNAGSPDDWITNVTYAGISNDSNNEPCDCSYADNTAQEANVSVGGTDTLSVTFCSEGVWTQYVIVWIDWDQSGTFDADELYDLGSGVDATLTLDITVPGDAADGCTTMRVTERYSTGSSDPCESYSYGEAEDYTVCVGGGGGGGGDTCEDAIVIGSLPFSDADSTVGATDDYDEVCPYTGSTSPDVVYSYIAECDETVAITLCNGSLYDTKLYVYDTTCGANPFACNDDTCPGYVSELTDLALVGGTTYYIVVDGYGGDAGEYVIDITSSGCGGGCGDGNCDEGEDCNNCEDDCGPCGGGCGDGEDWFEDFESYDDSSSMHGQGCWEGWGGDPTWTAYLQETTSHSPNSAVDINGDADLVRVFAGYDSGVWNFCSWQYIPEGFSGLSYYILLNGYPAFNWSTQIGFDSATGLVTDTSDDSTLPMILGAWVELCVEIDLISDSQTITYGGEVLNTTSWTEALPPTGTLNIGALDLFANGASSIYYDDFSLTLKAAADGDECEDCFVVGEGTYEGTTTDNTGTTDDTSCAFSDGVDEWYCYTASCTGFATASLCGSTYDTTLAVFDACGGAELGCDDDSCGLQSELAGDDGGTDDAWPVVMGETYNIRVSGFNNQSGDYTLTIECLTSGPVCGNDVCEAKEDCKNCPEDCGVCPPDCPLSTCADGVATITESNSTEDGGGQVACGAGGNTTENSWARCFDLTEEGMTEDVTIDSVTFGVQQATIDGITVNVNLYLDGDGCPPVEPGVDAILLDTVSTVVNMADEGTLITLVFPGAPVAPAGSTLIVEIEAPADGTEEPLHAFRARANPDGQCGPSYIRSESCGLGWTDLADIGFPDAHLVLVVDGSCGGGGGDGDECEDCMSIEEGVAVNGTTADNTGDVDDSSCVFNDFIDEWYCYTACETSTVTASLCGSLYDTGLAVFDSCGGAEIVCNDDFCGLQSELSWSATDGVTYYVRVSGYNNNTGDYTLLIDQNGCVPPEACEPEGAANDCCETANAVECGDTPYDSTGANTDGDPHPECQFDGQTYHDLWWEHIAGDSGNLNVNLCSSSYDTDLVVYDGCDCTDLVVLGCNDDSCPGFMSEVNVPVVGGNCYLIRTGGWNDGDMGNGVLSISGAGCVPPCGNGTCDEGENACNCPEDCGGECLCTIYTDQAEFEAANADHGKILKGVEDFEEGILIPAAVDGLDDPLCGGIPNAPDAFPYPEGLTQLNICVQSNFEHSPAAPNPRGINGLAAASAGFAGAISDIVVANTFVDSLDMMFGDPVPPDQQDNHTGVGFDTLSLLGGTSVDIQVYDKNNVLMAEDTSPADVGGSNFWGIWCSSTIGRINIFDSAGGAEGGDNIQMWLEELFCQSDDKCNDGDACTDDICDPDDPNADEFGCVHDDISESCNDGNVCNGEETCDPDAGCQDGKPLDCNDGVECTVDDCDPVDGCSNTPNDGACDDGNACNGEETCDAVDDCQDGEAINCDDGVDCTDDSCDPASGACTNAPNDGACDDGSACTIDTCDPEAGCVYEDIDQTLIIKQGASGPGPDNCPAPVNANSNGVIPILLVGTDDFDVHTVDQASLDLHLCGDGPSGVQPIAGHTKFKDLNHPTDLPVGCPGCQCNDDESSDGIDDLSMKFSTSEVVDGLPAGSYTLELTGTANGVPFCARDCIIVVPPGSGLMNAMMESNVQDTLLEVTPMDLNFDIDGFADFSRAYVEGTSITLTAPTTSNGRRFLRWSIDGEMQGFGIRTIDVTISEDTTLKAFYQRPSRVVPELPTEGSGDME